MNKVLIVFFLMFAFGSSKAQATFNGTYYHSDAPIVDNAEGSEYEFKENGKFKITTTGELGRISYGSGHYRIEGDSLVLNYDSTEIPLNEYHVERVYYNDRDSISVVINFFDKRNNSIPNHSVLLPQREQSYRGDNQGKVEMKFKKEKDPLNLEIPNVFLGYNLTIVPDKNYVIDVFINLEIQAMAIKDQIEYFKVLEQTDEKLLLLDRNNQLLNLVRIRK